MFSQDSRWILTAGRDCVRVWDAATLKPVTPILEHGAAIRNAALSPDGRLVLTVGGKEVHLWDSRTGQRLTILKHLSAVLCAAFSPDSRLVVTAGFNARVWDVATGRERLVLDHDAAVPFAVFSPDGSKVLTIGDSRPNGAAYIWDVATGRRITGPLAEANCDWISSRDLSPAAFSPDGKRVATIDFKGAAIWDAATGKQLAWAEVWREDELGTIESVAFSPDGSRVAAAWPGEDGTDIYDVPADPSKRK